jgi:hypothetical protein
MELGHLEALQTWSHFGAVLQSKSGHTVLIRPLRLIEHLCMCVGARARARVCACAHARARLRVPLRSPKKAPPTPPSCFSRRRRPTSNAPRECTQSQLLPSSRACTLHCTALHCRQEVVAVVVVLPYWTRHCFSAATSARATTSCKHALRRRLEGILRIIPHPISAAEAAEARLEPSAPLALERVRVRLLHSRRRRCVVPLQNNSAGDGPWQRIAVGY